MVHARISSRSRICLGESRVLSANLSSCSRRSFVMRKAWSLKNIMIQDMANSENSMNTTKSTDINIFKNINHLQNFDILHSNGDTESQS